MVFGCVWYRWAAILRELSAVKPTMAGWEPINNGDSIGIRAPKICRMGQNLLNGKIRPCGLLNIHKCQMYPHVLIQVLDGLDSWPRLKLSRILHVDCPLDWSFQQMNHYGAWSWFVYIHSTSQTLFQSQPAKTYSKVNRPDIIPKTIWFIKDGFVEDSRILMIGLVISNVLILGGTFFVLCLIGVFLVYPGEKKVSSVSESLTGSI